jgi:hypothetical protein
MTVQTATCGVQFCPATHPRPYSIGVWYCARHRWPGGEGNEGVTVNVNGADARFLDGVAYIIEGSVGRGVRMGFNGVFRLKESDNGRLRFDDGFTWLEIDPDHIDRVVAI